MRVALREAKESRANANLVASLGLVQEADGRYQLKHTAGGVDLVVILALTTGPPTRGAPLPHCPTGQLLCPEVLPVTMPIWPTI